MSLFPHIVDTKHKPRCGPTAVGFLTGVPASVIEKKIRRMRKGFKDSLGRKRAIKGTWTSEIVSTLKSLGCKVTEYKIPTKKGRMSVTAFMEDTRHLEGAFLIRSSGHMMVCEKGMFADNWNDVPVSLSPKNRLITNAWRVVAPAVPKYTPEMLLNSAPPKPKKDIKVARAEKVAKDIKRWERKEKLAKTKLKKLRSQLKRYQKNGVL